MDYFVELISGPGTLRFFIQPTIAILLGIRDGRSDARSGRPPFLSSLLFRSGERKETLAQGWRAITVPFIIAVVFDSILQIYVFEVLRLQWALVVGVFLVGLPYSISRGILNRIIRSRG